MRWRKWGMISSVLVVVAWLAGGFRFASAQAPGTPGPGTPETGFAVKKPVIGAACPRCPWGSMAEVVKAAMKPYGWDVQICYYCAGSARAARLVAAAAMATPRANPTPEDLPTPKGRIDFGVTGLEFLQWAYLGIHDFARDPGTPSKHLRLIANIQEINYYLVAVKANSGITDLRQIVEKRLPVKMIATMGIGGDFTPTVMKYYGITEEKVKSFGGSFCSECAYDEKYVRANDADVFVGFGSLTNPPEYNLWYEVTQKYDLKYLELAPDLKQQLMKEFYVREGTIPLGAFRSVDKPIPTVIRNGTVLYGRADMPDDFAYALAKALDEQQALLGFANSSMNWSYNRHTVWKALDIPLHPGAARYYKEVGFMK